MLHIEESYRDNVFTTYCVEGLSVKEMNAVLNARENGFDERDVLVNVMRNHDNDSHYGKNIAEAWRNGYGIYGIRHVGGHLFVKVGNSCD